MRRRNRTSNRNQKALWRGRDLGAGRDNNVPFIRQNGPVQKLQYPDNPRNARSQLKRGRIEKTAAGMKVPVERVFSLAREHECAVEIEGSCRDELANVGDNQLTSAQTSRNFNGHIGPENRLQSISPFHFCRFFYPHVLKSWKVGIFSPNTTRCCGLKRPSTKRVR